MPRVRADDADSALAPSDELKISPIRLESYVPFFLGSIANKWTAVSSRAYRDRFDLGIGEWRVLASLAVKDAASSIEISKLVKMDNGAVSRSMRVLEERGLVLPLKGRFTGRTKPYLLTERGTQTFEAMKAMALEREQKLLDPLDPDQRTKLLQLLSELYRTLDDLDQ